MMSVPVCISRKILASMQLAFRQILTFSRQETLILCRRQHHLLSWLAAAIENCLVVVGSFLIVFLRGAMANHCLELLGCHGEPCCLLLHIVCPAPVSSSLMETLIHDLQFDHYSCLPDPES